MFALVSALPSYEPPRDFDHWFFALLRNTVFDGLRKHYRSREVLMDPALLPEPDPAHPEYTEALTLRKAVQDLPEELGLAVVLHLYSDMTFKEMGEITGVSEHTWSSRYRRARQVLRDRLGDSW